VQLGDERCATSRLEGHRRPRGRGLEGAGHQEDLGDLVSYFVLPGFGTIHM
jgi:hypothetical protein